MTTTLCKTLGIGIASIVLAACTLDEVFGLHIDWDFCKLFFEPSTQFQDPTGAPPVIVFEDPSTIVVYHGSACADSDSHTEVRVRQSITLPAYANSATVFLNGWHLRYAEDDHHVTGVAAFIRTITRERNELSWEAVGALGDEDEFENGFNFCYYYTIVGWNATRLNASVDHSDGSCDPNDTSESNFFAAANDAHTTSLSCFPSYGKVAAAGPAAVVPRGFGFAFIGGDSHLLQIALNMDHSEGFVTGGQAYNKRLGTVTPVPAGPDPATVLSHVADGYVSWETYGVFKDNSFRRRYGLGQLVSTIAGRDVGVIQPPFAVLPDEDSGACLGSPVGTTSSAFAIDKIPYVYAIPMLTGWDLSYKCDDGHVREVGVWLDDIHYELNDPSRTLRYTLFSILSDDENKGYSVRHNVSVLGFRPSQIAPPIL